MQARFQIEGFRGCCWGWFAILVWIACRGWVHGAERVVRLAWDPSVSPDVTGYVITYGSESGRYVFTNEVARALQAAVMLPVSGETYYLAAKARNGAGIYSEPSNEVSYQSRADPQIRRSYPWQLRLRKIRWCKDPLARQPPIRRR